MKTRIVYDSVFGNTGKVAQAIGQAVANALGSQEAVQILPVGQVTADQLNDLDLLIVGSPTRGFRPTPAVIQLLKSLPKNQLSGVAVAAFDTRIDLETIEASALRFLVDKGGYAASTIAKSMQKKGGKPIAAPEGFLVTGEEGPLKDGELERAEAWAQALSQQLSLK